MDETHPQVRRDSGQGNHLARELQRWRSWKSSDKNLKLSPVVARYFDIWIRQETWDSGHWSDRERFYQFVKAVKRYSRRSVSRYQIQTLIIVRCKHRRDRAVLEIKAEKYGEIYQTLLEYERTSGFPDALIDRKNILAFYNRLRRSGRQNDQHIDRMMNSRLV